MSDDLNSTSAGIESSPAVFIAEYGNLLSRYGPDSIPANQFLDAHRDRPDFNELAQTAARMKESALRLKTSVELQDQIVRDRFSQFGSLEQQITKLEMERQIRKLRAFAVVAVVTVAAVGAIIGATSRYRAETLKNKELLHLLNMAVAPFAYYKIPEIEKDNQTSQSTYNAVEKLARTRKPTDYPLEWSRPLLYVWARSALVNWQDSDYTDDARLREVESRINYIRGRDPQYARIDALQAQVEIGKAFHARKTGGQAAERAAYEAAVQFNEAALAKQADLLLARQNLADALDRLGQVAPPAEKLGYIERARVQAEQAVALAKPLFLRGQEASFVTYLDTLGEIYQHLYEQYETLPTPSEREEKQKRWLCDARAIYQAIAWNYERVSFEKWDPANVKLYRDTKEDNLKRLKYIEDLARQLGVSCAAEPPSTRAESAK